MRAHNGMRPQDVVILLKILVSSAPDWQYRDLASDLYISVSEIAESLNRSHLAGLVDESRRKVYRESLMEFLEHGLHYVFPQLPGSMVTGIPTAHSHPAYASRLISELTYVWPDPEQGSVRGLAIEPLYKNVVKAVRKDAALYELLASIDIIRVGRVRELNMALDLLKSKIML